ncbi:MAG: DUF2203 domain-containing protein [Nannocystaceae bacterium]|nr:DUF2203 domain-containing protein [Nannocystaceae bacterium]
MQERYLSLAHVNALIPDLAGRVNQLLQLNLHLRTMCRQLVAEGVRISPESLARGEPVEGESRARSRVAQARAVFETVRETIADIEKLGGELKDVETGLVDFRSLIDGEREVLLCWRLGERQVQWWHELDAGFAGRQSIDGHAFVAEPRDAGA